MSILKRFAVCFNLFVLLFLVTPCIPIKQKTEKGNKLSPNYKSELVDKTVYLCNAANSKSKKKKKKHRKRTPFLPTPLSRTDHIAALMLLDDSPLP